MTAAEELRAAAEKLRHHANLTLMDVLTSPFYESEIVPATAPDGRYAHGMRSGMGGAPGDLGALFTPGVATALAEWLDHFADTQFDTEADIQVMDHSHELMLALARLINPKEQQ